MRSIFLVSVCLFISRSAVAFPADDAEIIQNPGCADGSHVYLQKKGPYGLMISCEGALGKYATVVYFRNMGPSVEKWTIGKRFWNESSWGDNIRDFAWIGNDRLLITTNATTEKPSAYLLQLGSKTYKRIHASADETDLSIDDIKKGVLHLSETRDEKSKVVKVKL